MNTSNIETCLGIGSHDSILELAGRLIYERVYLLTLRFNCEEDEAYHFLWESILEKLLKSSPSMSMCEYSMSVGNYIGDEFIIVFDENEVYYIFNADEYEEETNMREYSLKDEDYKKIFNEITKLVNNEINKTNI